MRETAETVELKAKLKTKIEETKDRLVSLLQAYSTSQVELWRQVPELAKEANRLNRFTSGRYLMASICFLWPISPSFPHGLQVDLRTGEIRSGSDGSSLETLALGQIGSVLEQLDASEVIKSLKDTIRVLAGDHTRICQGHDLGGAYEV